MKSHARVVVIGGGVVGCSVLYHLTKLGWSDVLLIERKELTAGSSWHAAGGFHAINGDISIARLQAYTISLYREIEAASGQDVGLRMTGGLNIAATGERWDSLKAEWARHRVMGIDSELVGPEEVKRLCPIIDTTGILGAIYDRNEGHLDPSGATHAYAKAARLKGAEIARQTRVMELMRTPAGLWRVMTDQGTVEAEHVVNAAGLWAREVGAMAGARLPLIPIEHHYLITADIPELAALPQLIPVCADLDGGIYVRQEGKGALLGVYEPDPRPWAEDGTPWDYGDTELLPPNLDRLSDTLAHGLARFPPVAIAGIKRVVNGPFTFTPDGNPLVGPIAGIPNYWCACGVMAGFAQGGGVGLSLAEWIVSGEPQADIFGMDVARFGEFATPGYTREKSREFYSRRFQIAYPNEFWPAMRPLKTTPVHDMLGARNAVFGVSYGLEVPLYFAASKDTAHEVPSLRRSNAFPIVAEECAAARSAVVALDASSFAKYEVAGRGAEAWLDWLLPVRMPEPGRIRLAPMLGDGGRLMGDLTVMRLAADRFLVFGSGYLQAWHMRWFRERLPDRAVAVANLTEQLGGFAISGPHARTLLGGLTGADVSDDAIRFFSVRRMEVGPIDAIVARLSITGELGYEIYVPNLHLRALYARIQELGEGLGLRDIGIHALNALRLEKSYGIWSREFSREYTPRMAGLDRLIAYDKPGFVGREAALRDMDRAMPNILAAFAIEAADADAAGFEPIWSGDELAGYTTSGGFGHCAGLSLALGYIKPDLTRSGAPLAISILGERRPARLLDQPPIDPRGDRMRS